MEQAPIHAVLFDIDGLVIVGREEYFSERFAREHGVPVEKVSEFFLGNFKKCTFGQADLKEEIAPYLPSWGWTGSVDDFLEEWFKNEAAVDEQVLQVVTALRKAGVRCYIATRQEKYRLRYLLETVGLNKYFDGAFASCDIGFDKHEPEFFQFVFKTLGISAPEILFFDDAQKNIDMAESLGIQAHFYDSIEVLHEKTKPLLV